MARQRQFTPLEIEALKGLIADGEQYPSELRKNVFKNTEGEVFLGPGTLPNILNRLGEKGYIADAGEQHPQGNIHQSYGITEDGVNAVIEEMDRYDEITSEARAILEQYGSRFRRS